jgi:hypothetical protein
LAGDDGGAEEVSAVEREGFAVEPAETSGDGDGEGPAATIEVRPVEPVKTTEVSLHP